MSMTVATAPTTSSRHPGRCSCSYCRTVRSQKTRRWRQRSIDGAVFWVDAAPVRAHVRAIMNDYGVPLDTIAEQAGVSYGTARNLIYGNGSPPSARMLPNSAHRLLAVRFDLDALRDVSLINPAGTRRRVQGLVVAGYCIAEQARQLGRDRGFYRTISVPAVRADLARAVRDLADALEAVPPPDDTHAERAAVSKALRMARQHPEWVPLSAWEDIDDPNATPLSRECGDTLPDPVMVARILTGVHSIKELHEADVYAAVIQFQARGEGITTISEHLKCNGDRARQLVRRAAVYERLALLDSRAELRLRLTAHDRTDVFHIAVADDAAALCRLETTGEPRPVRRGPARILVCRRCLLILGPFAPRVDELLS